MIEVVLPTIALILAPILKKRGAVITSLTFFVTSILILLRLVRMDVFYSKVADLPNPIGAFYVYGDCISHIFGFTIAFVSAFVSLYSTPYMKHRFEEMGLSLDEFGKYWLLYNAYAYSMLLLVYSGNLLMLYVFLEISLVTSFLLIYYYGYGKRQWVAMLYFVWTHIAGVLALIGFILIGLNNNTLLMPMIKAVPFIAWILVFLGMLVKLPGLGFHIWLPYAHAEAPTPVSALLSPLTVGLAGYVILRLYEIDPSFIFNHRHLIFAYGFLTSFVAGLLVFKQNDFKKLLAYSTVSQMGYMIMAICLGSYGVMGLVIQYVSHAFGKAILFMSAGSIIALYGLRRLDYMGGFHEQIPQIANASLIGFMNLSGIVTIGLIGELFILRGAFETFQKIGWEVIAVILVFIVSGLYSFYTMKNVFYGKPKDYPVKKPSLLLVTPLYAIGIVSIALLFCGEFVIRALMEVFI
ncbi:complex I subunit 5 family protein [Archaeoglobus sp.]